MVYCGCFLGKWCGGVGKGVVVGCGCYCSVVFGFFSRMFWCLLMLIGMLL